MKSKKFQEYQLQSGAKRWHVHAYLGTDPRTGKPKYFDHQGYKTKSDAKDALDEAAADFKRGKDITSRNTSPKLQEVYDEWLPLYAENVRNSTLENAKILWRCRIKPTFGDVYVDMITPADCQRWCNAQAKKYTVVHDVKSRLHQIFDFAVRNGYMTTNPLASVIIPRKRKESAHIKQNYFELHELKRFADTAVSEYKNDHTIRRRRACLSLLLLVIASTGMRSGEARALRWQSVNFETGEISITESANRTDGHVGIGDTKTAAGHRTAWAEGYTLELLRDWRKERLSVVGIQPKALIFAKVSTGKPLDGAAVTYCMTRICRLAGIKRITPHGLRHTKATIMAAEHVSAVEIAAVLGHTDPSFTERTYIHPTKAGSEHAEEKFRQLINL